MSTPLLENILNQPEALASVTAYQRSTGRDALERAAHLLAGKKRVLISGMGASLFGSIPFQYASSELGFQAVCIETAELLHSLPAWIDDDTAVILVSRSGESVEVIKMLPLIRRTRSIVIGIVNVPDSTLAKASDQTLVLQSPADQMVAIQTYTATVAVFSFLQGIIGRSLEIAAEEAAATANVLRTWISTCVEASRGWRDFADTAFPLYLLGRGPALATVLEGALLMHETAKAPAIGMSSAQFRHGPVEVVGDRFRGIIIGTGTATTELDTALLHDVMKMGGQVRWIGPGNGSQSLTEWPHGIPESFLPVTAIVPLQMLAYRKAEWSGVRPGDFRWAPLITAKEAGFDPVR